MRRIVGVLDVLKMGGPYARQTFLNASVVSDIKRRACTLLIVLAGLLQLRLESNSTLVRTEGVRQRQPQPSDVSTERRDGLRALFLPGRSASSRRGSTLSFTTV